MSTTEGIVILEMTLEISQRMTAITTTMSSKVVRALARQWNLRQNLVSHVASSHMQFLFTYEPCSEMKENLLGNLGLWKHVIVDKQVLKVVVQPAVT